MDQQRTSQQSEQTQRLKRRVEKHGQDGPLTFGEAIQFSARLDALEHPAPPQPSEASSEFPRAVRPGEDLTNVLVRGAKVRLRNNTERTVDFIDEKSLRVWPISLTRPLKEGNWVYNPYGRWHNNEKSPEDIVEIFSILSPPAITYPYRVQPGEDLTKVLSVGAVVRSRNGKLRMVEVIRDDEPAITTNPVNGNWSFRRDGTWFNRGVKLVEPTPYDIVEIFSAAPTSTTEQPSTAPPASDIDAALEQIVQQFGGIVLSEQYRVRRALIAARPIISAHARAAAFEEAAKIADAQAKTTYLEDGMPRNGGYRSGCYDSAAAIRVNK